MRSDPSKQLQVDCETLTFFDFGRPQILYPAYGIRAVWSYFLVLRDLKLFIRSEAFFKLVHQLILAFAT